MSYSSETFCCNHDDSDGLSHVLNVSRRRLQWNIDQLGCDCIDICAVVFRTHSVVMCRYVCGSVKYELISLHLVCLDDGFETYSNGILNPRLCTSVPLRFFTVYEFNDTVLFKFDLVALHKRNWRHVARICFLIF